MLGVETAALPASLRRTNQRTLVSLLQRLGSASKADLAKAAGLSQATTGKIITELARLGILEETSTVSNGHTGSNLRPRLGRPGQMVTLDSRHARFVAIELGVEETCIAALPVAAQLTDDWTFRFRTPASPDAWAQQIKRIGAAIPARNLWGVLVSVPGIVDERAGKVLLSPNLHWLENTDLPGLVRRAWSLPVVLLQEIRALALGQLAAAPGAEDFLLVDFGVGIGGAVVRAGKLDSSRLPLTGEIGHTLVEGNKRQCGCGAVGCLETLVSQRGLVESFRAAQNGPGRAWPDLVRHVAAHGVEDWLAQTLTRTANVISGTLNVLGLSDAVLTGFLMDLPDEVVQLLASEVGRGTLWRRFGKVVCHGANRRRAAGLVISGVDRLVLPSNQEHGLILSARPATLKLERSR